MLILNQAEVKKALPMDKAISGMKKAYAALSDNRAQVPLRAKLEIPPMQALGLFMPGFVEDPQGNALAVKVVTLFPNNPGINLPFIHAGVLVMDPENGQLVALLEGGSLTAIRTGAASGAATDLLSRKDSKIGAIFGAGIQARTQLEAICTVRPLETIWLYDLSISKAQQFADEMAGQGVVPRDVRVADNPKQAVQHADIICTATTALKPVFDHHDLKAGVHINGVGSYTPEMQEIPAATVQSALVTVDSIDACMAEAGDLIQPLKQGIIAQEHINTELGEIILGKKPGRTSSDQLTFFKSVGVAVQDVIAAKIALENATTFDLGQVVAW